MYQVFGFHPSRMLRVTWTLEEIGAPYEVIPTRPRSAEARALNPSGKIPALRDNDLTVVDSAAICVYLADKHSGAGLAFPAGTPERARHDSLLQFAIGDLEPPLWTLSMHSYILPDQARVPEIVPTCAPTFAEAIKALDARLAADAAAASPFLFGDKFTVADVFMGHIGGWAKKAGFAVESARVSAYFDALAARPSLARAVAKERAAMSAQN